MITNIFATLTNWIKSDWNRQKKFPQVKEEMTVVKVYVDYALLSAPLLSQLMGINIHMDHPASIHVILIIFCCSFVLWYQYSNRSGYALLRLQSRWSPQQFGTKPLEEYIMLVRNWSTIISRLSNKSLHDHVLSMDIDKKLWKLVNTISNSRRLSIIGNYWVSGKSRFPNVCCHKLVGSSMRLCCSNGEGGENLT